MMLLRKIFDCGIEQLQIAFGEDFKMTKDKAMIWYKYSKHLADNTWQSKIKNCIKGCRRIPTLADILDLSGYYIDRKELVEMEKTKRDREWQDIKEKPKGNFVPMPKKIKEKLDNLVRKWSIRK